MLSKHHNLIAFGQSAVTGSLTGISSGLNKIERVVPVQNASAAADVNKAFKISVVVSDDQKTFSIYCWKVTGTSDTALIAATSAVNVDWIAFGE